jgi:hypothetical protein
MQNRSHSSAVEHLTFNQRADGSNPSGITKIHLGYDVFISFDKDIKRYEVCFDEKHKSKPVYFKLMDFLTFSSFTWNHLERLMDHE